MKYLRNRKTGAIFPYSETLERLNRNVEVIEDKAPKQERRSKEPVHEPIQEVANDVVADDVVTSDVPGDDASKDELVAFAQNAFGVKLDKRSSVESLRQKVAELVAA